MPYPAGATTVANGERDEHSRAITSAFATVPGRICGAASLTSTRSNGSSATSIARRSVAAGGVRNGAYTLSISCQCAPALG